MELIAEVGGVFLYSWAGMGATCAFFTSTVAKDAGFGQLLNIAFAYAMAIALAIMITGPTSGSHINPCFTICFAVFKGFPWRKVPQYIAAQILGGMLAGLLVYVQYKQPLDTIFDEFQALGLGEMVFTPSGPAGAIALFTQPGQKIGYVFINEFLGAFIIAVGVFSVLDPSNIFVSPSTAPFLIGCLYFVTIVCFATQSLALNTARDLGGRFAAGIIWGHHCFPPAYTALAALTNIAASLCGALFQILILSDATRPLINVPPHANPPTEPTMPMEKNGNVDYMPKNGGQFDSDNGSHLEGGPMHVVNHQHSQ